jgi:uncharacterized protein (DUF342 family)
MVNLKSNVQLHGDHIEWNKELSFYQDSITTFENRLSELSEDYESLESRKKIEHFQNQFIIQRNAVDKLKNLIQKHEIVIGVNEKTGVQTEPTLNDENYHNYIAEKIDDHRKLFNELKDEFYHFVTEVV